MQEWPLNEQLIFSIIKKGFCLKLMQINNYHSDTIYLYWMYYVNCHSEINIKLVIWIVYIKLCSTFLTLILPGVGAKFAPPPCSFLGTVQKRSMLSMFNLYVNSCYICVVTPKLWFGQKNWFWGIFRLSKLPNFENYGIRKSKNCNFRVLRGIFWG